MFLIAIPTLRPVQDMGRDMGKVLYSMPYLYMASPNTISARFKYRQHRCAIQCNLIFRTTISAATYYMTIHGNVYFSPLWIWRDAE